MSDSLLVFCVSRRVDRLDDLQSVIEILGVEGNRAILQTRIPELHWAGPTYAWYQADDGSRLELNVHADFIGVKRWGSPGRDDGKAVTALMRIANLPDWQVVDSETAAFWVRPMKERE